MSARVWSMLTTLAVTAGAGVARRMFGKFWTSATGKTPPTDPTDQTVDVKEAVVWAALSAALLAVVKAFASRRAANYYFKSTGKLPR